MKVLEKKISVIIPVYNAEKYISETLDSIMKQSYKNREIILVENGSKDRSSDIIQEYEEKYQEIHMIKGVGKGPGSARNRGMEFASGEYIIFVDSDDYLPDTDIFDQYVHAAEQTDADIVVSNYARLWDGKLLSTVKTQSFALSGPLSEDFRFQGFFLWERCRMCGENFTDEVFWKKIRLLLQTSHMRKINYLICSVMSVRQSIYFYRNKGMFTAKIKNPFPGAIIRIQLLTGLKSPIL